MRNGDPTDFTRLSDGTLLRRQTDGSFLPVASATDHAGLASLLDEDIEHMASSDPDHPGLDDDFWATVGAPAPAKEAISIKLDSDVLRYFRKDGKGYQTRISAVLRSYMRAEHKAS